MAQTLSDRELIAIIKRRDAAAMGQLYDRYGKIAYTVILHIVQDEDLAEDLLAETLVKVWNQIGRWDDDAQQDVGLWLMLMARDHAMEYLRGVNDPIPRLPKLTALAQPAVLQAFPRPHDSELMERALSVFETLDEQERQIMEMACFDGLSTGEIASRTSLPLSTVRAIMSGVVRKLADS